MASCHAFYKDFVKACIYYKKLLDLEPDNVGVMGTYGRVLALAGKVEDSMKILESALHLAEERNEEQLIEQVCTTNMFPHMDNCATVPSSILRRKYSNPSCKLVCISSFMRAFISRQLLKKLYMKCDSSLPWQFDYHVLFFYASLRALSVYMLELPSCASIMKTKKRKELH